MVQILLILMPYVVSAVQYLMVEPRTGEPVLSAIASSTASVSLATRVLKHLLPSLLTPPPALLHNTAISNRHLPVKVKTKT